ncbi:MAG: S-methyl-5-thioribose-1-phosphate isomerase [Anaerolineae bacterium]|nr:S-methyl-5-thioribose-1-phosphate isomerase [Anaerolineae bacterium]
MCMRTVEWRDGKVRMIDQRRLPNQFVVAEYSDYRAVAQAIRDMVVRGAPAIGATAAFALALAGQNSPAPTRAALLVDLDAAAAVIRQARPTAANLNWGLDRLLRRAQATDGSANDVRAALVAEAQAVADEDVAINRRMGANGATLVPQGATILHHCNTGALATVDYGTALGVVRAAWEGGNPVHVLVDETRPRLQGAKLTAWELKELGIPQTLIADNAAGLFMQSGRVNLCLVGADRIAANGDTANKIGTYNLAVLAKENGIPFYVVAPTSTIDLDCPTGAAIPIEERDPAEVTHMGGERIAPEGVAVANPAFDVTPARYITAIVTEEGIVRPPYETGLREVVERARVI